MNVLENINLLKQDMKKQNWVIDSFMFKYKSTEYVVLVKLYDAKEKKPKYASVKLEFLKLVDTKESLEMPANRNRLMIETEKLISYFGIETANGKTDISLEFAKQLSINIPTSVSGGKNKVQKNVMISSLRKSDSENPNKIYCYKVRRNPNRADGSPGKRSAYNDNVTRILRPVLYEKLHTDKSLSFCYSDDSSRHKEDGEIIANWAISNRSH